MAVCVRQLNISIRWALTMKFARIKVTKMAKILFYRKFKTHLTKDLRKSKNKSCCKISSSILSSMINRQKRLKLSKMYQERTIFSTVMTKTKIRRE